MVSVTATVTVVLATARSGAQSSMSAVAQAATKRLRDLEEFHSGIIRLLLTEKGLRNMKKTTAAVGRHPLKREPCQASSSVAGRQFSRQGESMPSPSTLISFLGAQRSRGCKPSKQIALYLSR